MSKAIPGLLKSNRNRDVTIEEIEKIQDLDSFDLIMLISDIHDHGWEMGRRTLSMMPKGTRKSTDG